MLELVFWLLLNTGVERVFIKLVFIFVFFFVLLWVVFLLNTPHYL